MTDIDQQRFPGTPAPAGSQSTIVEQTRAAAEVVAAVQAARAVPRDEVRAYDRMRETCRRWETALRAFYAYPQGGKVIHGPTVALARDLIGLFGNCDYGTVELSRDDVERRSEVKAWAWDMEMNTRASRSVIVPHVGYVGSNGRKLTEMRAIDQNNNSVGGRAEREVVFKILPNDYVEEAKALCQRTLDEGGGVPIAERVTEILDIFGKARPPVTQLTLEDYVGHPKARWTGNDVGRLFVLFESLKQQTITRAEAFPNEVGITSEDIRRQAAAGRPAVDPPAPDPDPALAADPTDRPEWQGGTPS